MLTFAPIAALAAGCRRFVLLRGMEGTVAWVPCICAKKDFNLQQEALLCIPGIVYVPWQAAELELMLGELLTDDPKKNLLMP